MREGGFVLASTLVLTLLHSILALSGMQASRMETAMVRNAQFHLKSLLHAETVVSMAERQWKERTLECLWDVAACSQDILASLDTPSPVPGDFENGNSLYSGKHVVGIGDTVFLEWIARRHVPGDSQKQISIYRIRSKAENETGKSTIVETLFQICTNSDGSPCPEE